MKLSDGFNGADLRNVCTEAGWFNIAVFKGAVPRRNFVFLYFHRCGKC